MKLDVYVTAAFLLLLCLPEGYYGWFFSFPSRRIRKARALVNELEQGKSHMKEDVSVVSVGTNECGIQLLNQHSRSIDQDDDEVIYVDRGEFLTPNCGMETSLGRALQKYFANSHHENCENGYNNLDKPSMYIAIYLCLHQVGELANNKKFARYLDTLPTYQQMQHVPVFWDENSLQELRGSPVQEAVTKRRAEWETEFRTITTAIADTGSDPGLFPVDLNTWFWARSIVTSRAFGDDKVTGSPCLVPYVDMMNHMSSTDEMTGNKIKCSWEIDEEGYHLHLPGPKSDMPGLSPQLEISYGSHSNANFLINYGFSVLDDEYQLRKENAILSLKLPDTADSDEAEALWEADGLGGCHEIFRNVTVAIGNAGPIESVLSLCRVASAKGQELRQMREKFRRQGEKTSETEDGLVPQMGATLCRSPYSVENEIRALLMLGDIATESLERYDTTIIQDDELLKKPNLSHHLRNALILRRGEKLVLEHYKNLASIALRFLQGVGDFQVYEGMLEASLESDEPMLTMATS